MSNKTWDLVWVSSNSGQQALGYWDFRSDGTYEWRCSSPMDDGGRGTFTYADNTLTIEGFLKTNMVRSGNINLRFEGNQASFEDDNGVTWVYNPPSSCSLLLTPYIQVQTGRWRFDILPDGNDAARTLLTGQLSQEQQLITVSGDPALQGLLVDQNTWVVEAGPEFSIRGQFKETPANRFQGTYTRGDQSGQIFGYRLR